MTTTEGKLYFVELKTLERLEIQFVPERLTIARSPKLADIQIVGRNTPQYLYTGGETTLSLKLDFYSTDEDREDVITKCKWLESLPMNDGYNKAPSDIQLIFGALFKRDIWTIKDYSYDVLDFHKPSNYLPQQAYCNIVLGLNPKKNLSVSDVRNPFGNRSRPMF